MASDAIPALAPIRVSSATYSSFDLDDVNKVAETRQFHLHSIVNEGRLWIKLMARPVKKAIISSNGFNPAVKLPFNLRQSDFHSVMQDVYDFLYDANQFFSP